MVVFWLRDRVVAVTGVIVIIVVCLNRWSSLGYGWDDYDALIDAYEEKQQDYYRVFHLARSFVCAGCRPGGFSELSFVF